VRARREEGAGAAKPLSLQPWLSEGPYYEGKGRRRADERLSWTRGRLRVGKVPEQRAGRRPDRPSRL
jgi:hypothetical protein